MRLSFGLSSKVIPYLGLGLVCTVLMGCDQRTDTSQSSSNQASSQAQPASVPQTSLTQFTYQIAPVPLHIPQCNGQGCPSIELEQIKSNFPEINQLVEQYIQSYLASLVQGIDIDSITSASGNEASMPTSTTDSSPISQLDQIQQEEVAPKHAKTQSKIQSSINTFLALNAQNKALGAPGQLSVAIHPQVLNSQGPIVTVVLTANNYIGGAHGSSSQRYLNFDLHSRSILNLDSILMDGKRREFNDLAFSAFKNWVEVTQPGTDFQSYSELWKFSIPENFYLSPEGLVLQYGEYDIAPYSAGLPRLILPYDKLKGIIKPEFIPVISNLKQAIHADEAPQVSAS